MVVPPNPSDPLQVMDELRREIKALQKDIYGNPQIRQKGVFDRLDTLDERLGELRATYEREKAETGYFERIEAELDQLRLDYKIAIVYLRGIAAAVGTIVIGLVGAIVIGLLRFFAGGA